MAESRRPLFRAEALQHYMRRREPDILPRIIAPPVFAFLWLLLGMLVITGFLTWVEKIPTFANGTGVILSRAVAEDKTAAGTNTIALVFFPSSNSQQIRIGQVGQITLAGSRTNLTGRIIHTEAGTMDPDSLQERFSLNCDTITRALTQPSIAVEMRIGGNKLIAGSPVRAQIQTGGERILAFLPGLNMLPIPE